MILYFANRHFDIIGQATTELPNGLTITDDNKVEESETGVATFECSIHFDKSTRLHVEDCAEVGNYLLRRNNNENEFYTIIEAEIDTKNQEAYIYAEDAGMDLLNEMVGEYKADAAYPIDHYINRYVTKSGFEIGINEMDGIYRQLSFDSECTAVERIADIAALFDGCEVSYSFDVDALKVVKKYINIYRKLGADNGVTLRLNKEIDSIITSKSITNLATALQCTGGTPDDAESPITLLDYQYDDGDFYVDGTTVKSRKALEKWDRFFWKSDDSQQAGGHITRLFSSDTLSQAVLCEEAIAKLKQICDMEVNYKTEIAELPDNVRIGDRINIVDDAGELYLSARILRLESSVVDKKHKITLGEHLIKGSGISQKVKDLAAQFAKMTVSVTRATNIASNAKNIADEAQKQADAAIEDAEIAQVVANEAKNIADAATESASNAETKANNAQAAVEIVEKSVESLETSVVNAQAAAEQAHQAANTANDKAVEAQQAAQNAQNKADETAEALVVTQGKADNAIEKSDNAQSTAQQAISKAEAASATAAAAKLDAEQAQADIDAFSENLATLETTMIADYARKTDLTEATASLQTQITQNAAEISSTATKVQEIDETANNAAEQAEQAQTTAATAKTQADQATADAQAAQTAANNAALAANAAQSEADKAKTAAETAQSVADKAEADLESAMADLATVSGRVDATEAEIMAAQEAVETAQAAANKAKADAAEAATKANDAQETANTAVTNASNAQAAADEAASKAALAQEAANEAKGNAQAAQAKADEAASVAATAQETANTAKANADAAQATANNATEAASNAQAKADEADARAAQAAIDLATAQQNLLAVTSRVDATEEEVEAAQAAVITAQSAADKAKADAIAAQATADAAKADADAAQEAANTAKTAADNAQKAAEDAQAAADKAQADVDNLAVRVTTAETNILQSATKIELNAYKEEVTTTLGGYYTKEQTDAAIKVESNSITSTVSRTYATKQEVENIEIGGRNLLPNTDFDGESQRYERLEGYATEGGFRFAPTIQIESGAEYTLSAKIRGNANIIFYQICSEGGNHAAVWIARTKLSATDYQRFSITFIVDESRVFQEVFICTQYGDENTLIGDWFEIEPESLKLEKGNKVTDWTPAPEDVSNDIGEARSAADNAAVSIATAETTIQQLADSIAALVRDGSGGSLVRQDASGLWYFNIGEIEQSLSNTANGLDDLSGVVLDANGKIDVLQSTATALQERTEYVRSYTDENGQPCLELGEGDSVFKVRITNTEIQFAEGTDVPAKLNRKMLVIEKAMVKDELQFGDDEEVSGVWIWKRRSNGNLGLSWKGVTN